MRSVRPPRGLLQAKRTLATNLSEMRFEHLEDFGLGRRAHTLIDHLAALEQQQGGNAADPVAHRRAWIVVGVQLAHFHLADVLGGEGIDGGAHGLAGSTPGSPEINNKGVSGFSTSWSKAPSVKVSVFSAAMFLCIPWGSAPL